MKCSACSFDNQENSIFCQECGKSLNLPSNLDSIPQEKSISHEMEKIDDIIFKPKKHTSFIGYFFKVIFALIGVGVIIFVILIIIGLNTNNQTSQNNASVIENKVPTTFPIYSLAIEDLDSEWIGQQLYIKGILKNNYSFPAQNIKVRVNFYKDKTEENLFDTRYITILGVSANGAYSFKEPVYINPYNGQFWYVTQLESAEYLK